MNTSRFCMSTAAIAFLVHLSVAQEARADVVSQWNQVVVTTGGPQIQRTLAMVHIAMFDAVNAIEPRYRPYLVLPAPAAGASAEGAAAAAAHGVLVRLFPAQQATFDAALVISLAVVPDGPAEDDGVAYGDVVAEAIYTARLSDNILAPGPVYVPGTDPGDYQITSPGPPQPVNTNAPNWIPFALLSASQFRPDGPADLSSIRYARDVDEVHRLGAQQAPSAHQTRRSSPDGTQRWRSFNSTASPASSLRLMARTCWITRGSLRC